LKQQSRKLLKSSDTYSLEGILGGSVAFAMAKRTLKMSFFSDQGGFPTKSS
jgi:hypothetical protein